MYSVAGTYLYADGGETRPARLYFRNGELQQVFGYTGSADASAPREIVPSVGDQFTIQHPWMDLNAQGLVEATRTQDGGTLTFGEEPFTWVDEIAPAGTYLVGLVIEDLDGNRQQAYGQIEVQ